MWHTTYCKPEPTAIVDRPRKLTDAESKAFYDEVARFSKEAATVAIEQETIAVPQPSDPEDHLFKLYFAAKEYVGNLETTIDKASVEIAYLDGVVSSYKEASLGQSKVLEDYHKQSKEADQEILRLKGEIEKTVEIPKETAAWVGVLVITIAFIAGFALACTLSTESHPHVRILHQYR